MRYPTLTLNLIVFGALSIFTNAISLFALLNQRKGKTIRDNAGHLLLLALLSIDIGLSLLLIAPIVSFVTEQGTFTEATCEAYGALDMSLSLSQVVIASLIAFDRYIVTIAPKWGTWRCHSNYSKLVAILIVTTCLWSLVPMFGYGRFSTFHDNMFCSLDWRQGNMDETSPTSTAETHRYIAFLTATCLLFFLIPVCIASSFYYSIIDHVDRANSADAREEVSVSTQRTCTWAPKNHVAKVGLGCLLVSTLPLLGYSLVCLNPLKSQFVDISYVVVPVIVSRFTPLLNPIFYVALNPEIVPFEEKLEKHLAKRRPPPRPYHTITMIADVPGMSFPILTPTVPRRQLPSIPTHLINNNSLSPSDAIRHPML